MPGGYLLILLGGLTGLGLLDWRHRVAVWAKPRRALTTIGVGVLFFLLWDIAGIGLGIFFTGKISWLTGVMLAPNLPLEEPVFLVLLCYSALLGYLALERR